MTPQTTAPEERRGGRSKTRGEEENGKAALRWHVRATCPTDSWERPPRRNKAELCRVEALAIHPESALPWAETTKRPCWRKNLIGNDQSRSGFLLRTRPVGSPFGVSQEDVSGGSRARRVDWISAGDLRLRGQSHAG